MTELEVAHCANKFVYGYTLAQMIAYSSPSPIVKERVELSVASNVIV